MAEQKKPTAPAALLMEPETRDEWMTALPSDRTGQGAEVFGQSRGFMRQERLQRLHDGTVTLQ